MSSITQSPQSQSPIRQRDNIGPYCTGYYCTCEEPTHCSNDIVPSTLWMHLSTHDMFDDDGDDYFRPENRIDEHNGPGLEGPLSVTMGIGEAD